MPARPAATTAIERRPLRISADDARLDADLTLPQAPQALLLFAHGSGSGRHSPRNRHVADVLNAAGLATLLTDLLSPEEDLDRSARFDIDLLGRRLQQLIDAAADLPGCAGLPIGLFGASTGAAAALQAAVARPQQVGAVVSRGGRPDLAGANALSQVAAPTLLIVGSNDRPVVDMNYEALSMLRCEKALRLVPGATHLFEEPGTLDIAAGMARDWFLRHLAGTDGNARRH